MARIYLSSTYEDLKSHRDAVYKTLRRMGHDVIAMEDMEAADVRPLEACLRDVERCDVYIGIFAWRYGFIPLQGNPELKSITELEFRHARAKGKKCLFFLLSPDARWPVKFVDRGEQLGRIEALRGELQLESVVSFFTSSADLAGKVATDVAGVLAGRESRPATPRLGPIVHKKCDRAKQEARFIDFLSEEAESAPNRPQICIIDGDGDGAHESLVQRFHSLILCPRAELKYKAEEGAVPLKPIHGWPSEEDPAEMRKRLLRELFKAWDDKYEHRDRPYTAAEFVKLIPSTVKALVVQHNIRPRPWDTRAVRLIDWYLTFWDEVGTQADFPKAFVFLNVIYQSAATAPPPLRYLLNRFIRNLLENMCGARHTLEAASRGICPTVLLPKLGCVKPKDVLDWFEEHEINDESVENFSKQQTALMFAGKFIKCRPMSAIEPKLRHIMRTFEPEVG
jgi:hypothetical protein